MKTTPIFYTPQITSYPTKEDIKITTRLIEIKKKFGKPKYKNIPVSVSKETAIAMVLFYISIDKGMTTGSHIKEITVSKKRFNQEVGAFVHLHGMSTDHANFTNAKNEDINTAIKTVNKYF